jgi:hypothetical protein
MDKETAKQIRISDEVKQMTKSSGWGEVKRMIFDKIMELNDITSLAEADPTKLMIIIAAKQEAVKILLEWLNSVEGIAKNSDFLKKQFLEKQKADFIIKFDNSEQDF